MTQRTPPDLVALRLLVAVSNRGSIGQAARDHGITQPAASKRLAALETSLHMHLIDRRPRGSQLTAEGKVVADWAERVLDMIDQMLVDVASMRPNVDRDLRVAASMTVAEHLVPDWLSRLRAADPDLHVGLRVANSHDVQDLVLAGGADIGFVETPTLDKRLRSKRLSTDRLAVVVVPDHPWAARSEPLSRDDLARAQLVVREAGSGTRDTLDRVLQGSDTAAPPLLELGSNAAVKGAVMAGAGAAVLSVLAVASEISAGRLIEVAVRGVDLHRPLTAVWSRNTRLDGASKALLETAMRNRAAAP